MSKLVVFCTPVLGKPHPAYLAALEASLPAVEAAGWDHLYVNELNCPYISNARATMLRKAMDHRPDAVVFLDYDLSWDEEALSVLLETPGDVVAGTYRFKKDEEAYMGTVNTDAHGHPIVRADGCIQAEWIPAGFLKITADGLEKFAKGYPHLLYGSVLNPHLDLFNHGAHKGTWYGEDYAFSRNWNDLGERIWVLPDLNLVHHSPEQAYPGNFHEYLLRQPGGSKHPETKHGNLSAA